MTARFARNFSLFFVTENSPGWKVSHLLLRQMLGFDDTHPAVDRNNVTTSASALEQLVAI